jgi:uncharacterized protein YciI
MLWAITRISKPRLDEEAREKLRPFHRDYVQSQKHILVLGAAMQSDDGTEATGTLFVVNVNSRAEAQAFLDGDPFAQACYFTDVKITRLRKGPWNPEAMTDGA